MTKHGPKPTRAQEHRIEIKAPAAQVWKAISDGEELTRWFVEEAKITPNANGAYEGGRYWISWGAGMEGESRIEVWKPGELLRLTHAKPSEEMVECGLFPKAFLELEEPLVEEYRLESSGGATVLRLVHSGIPTSEDWDEYYDGTHRGWKTFLFGLRHYVEKHFGKPRRNVFVMLPVNASYEQIWDRLTGTDGLAREGTLAGLQAGERYRLTTALGERFEGTILMHVPPKSLVMTVDTIDDALLSVSIDDMAEKKLFYMTLATFGTTEADVDAIRARWLPWMQRLLPGVESQPA